MIRLLPFLFLVGCAGAGIPTGEAIKTLAPVAAEVLRDLAQKKGAIIDESGAVCFEAPDVRPDLEEFEGVEVTAIVCFAAHVE